MMGLMSTGTVAAILLAVGGGPDARMPSEVEKAVASLRRRHEQIGALSCAFRQKRTPTPYFVARAAKDLDLPPAKVAENYSTTSRTELVESADGRFCLEVMEILDAGKPKRKDRLGFGGKTRWKQAKVPLDDDPTGQQFRDSKTEIGGKNVEGLYGASGMPVVRFLGDTVLSFQKPLYGLIQEGRDWEALDEESISGAPCAVIRWRATVGGVEQRATVWLDKSRDLALRRYSEEYQVPEKGWLRTLVCEAAEMGVARSKGRSGEATDYHYPKVVLSEIYNTDDHEKTFDERCEFEEVRINPPVTADLFALQIDEGTGVFDLDTGKYSIYGRGPGPKLKQTIDKRIDEAHRQARESGLLEAPDVLNPPQSLATRGVWAGLALGVVGIACALTLKVRQSRRS